MFLKVLLILAAIVILVILGFNLYDYIHDKMYPSQAAWNREKEWKEKQEAQKREELQKAFVREISNYNIDSASHEFRNSEFAQYCLKNVSDCLDKALWTAKTKYLNLQVSNASVWLFDDSNDDLVDYCSIGFQSMGYKNLEVNKVIPFCLWLIAELKKKDPYLQIELDTWHFRTSIDEYNRSAHITHKIRTWYSPPVKTNNYKSW